MKKIKFLKGPDSGKVFDQPDAIADSAINAGVAVEYSPEEVIEEKVGNPEFEVKEEKAAINTKEEKTQVTNKGKRGRPKK